MEGMERGGNSDGRFVLGVVMTVDELRSVLKSEVNPLTV